MPISIAPMQVSFEDEVGVDSGGLTWEFWRLFAREVAEKYCIGDCGKCLFAKNIPALQVGVFVFSLLNYCEWSGHSL